MPEKPDIQLVLNDQVISGANNIANAFEHLKEHGYEDTVLLGDGSVRENEDFSLQNSETLFECHSWNFVHEWIDNIPQIQQGYDYCFFFQLTEEKYSDGLEFPLFMIAAILPRLETEDVVMGCSVEHSDDGKTIFIFCAETDI